MKKYNVKNYVRYKEDLKASMPEQKQYSFYSREELIIKFMPLVENISRKFATSQEASGVMSINDIIQEGNLNLTKAVDKIDWEKLINSDDLEKSLKSFLSKRIRGGIRRAIDKNRGTMRIPEHKLNEMRSTKDEKMVRMFFNSIFLSIDAISVESKPPLKDIVLSTACPGLNTSRNDLLIEAADAIDLTDVGRLVPNATLHPSATFTAAPNFIIRGVGVRHLHIQTPSTVVFFYQTKRYIFAIQFYTYHI